jgi:serine/threonine-protein kinase
MDTDRNLLFAVLALQADLLDRDRFIGACSLWAARKDTPIADLLVAEGWLSPAHRAVVEQLIEAKLRKHGGDAHKSLAEARGALTDAEAQRSLAALTAPPGRRDGLAAAEDFSTAPPGNTAGRNLLYEEIGRGGMGRVLRGRDPELRRDLAVKVLAEEYRDHPAVTRRFIEEAQVGGQLQHPGTVPVYELGHLADGCPFFAMKLVRGRTLAELLRERPSPQHDLARFLTIFEAVCQTMAYAHSKGVIHRDLKPANIMVGSFGEVQVMDWGLAKVLTAPPADEPDATTPGTLIRTARSDSTADEDGRTGVVGTPAFMAPEQARGEVEAVDERADVFGLGAVLCLILTGQPPYTGAGRDEVLVKAASGDLAEAQARLEGCGADEELLSLCRACLSPRRQDRPRDAGAVASRVAGYQSAVRERLRQAELARAAEAARAEEAQATAAAERKARQRTRALAASVLALVAVAAAGGLWVQRQRAERAAEAARQREAVEAALDKARELQRQARWPEARAVLEQTRDRLGEAGPENLRRRVERAAADVALVDRLDGIRLRRSTVVEGNFDNRGADQDYAATCREAGLGAEGDDPETVAGRIRASAVGEQLVAAVDDWATVTGDPKRWAWLLEVARRADPDDWRDRFRDPRVWRDRAGLEALTRELLADEQQLARQKPELLGALGLVLRSVQADAVPLLAAAQARYPDDFLLNLELANRLQDAKKWDEAIGFGRGAVAVRPSAAAAHYNLGRALYARGQLDEAIRGFRTAIELDPKHAKAHTNLGAALRDKGQLDEAIREFRTAIEINPRAASPHTNLGVALADKGQLDEAIREYRTAIELDPKNANPHTNLGEALRRKGQLDEAIREHRTAIALDPKYPTAHRNLGVALADKGQLDEAIREYRTAIELDPKDAKPHYNLGKALRAKGQLDEAIREYRTAIDLHPDDAEAHCNLGHCLRDQGQLAAALAELRKGHALGSRQPKWPYPSEQWVRQCDRLVQLEGRLPAILEGTDTPATDAERLALAELCQQPFKKHYAVAARFYAEVFAHDAKLADDLRQQHRYKAACATALAGCGQGEDARALPDKVALGLRRQALGWLRADLALYAKLAERDDPAAKQAVRQRLTR